MTTTLPAVAVQISPPDLAARLEAYAHDARGTMRPETLRALERGTLAFTRWMTRKGMAPLPASPATVALYVDEMATAGRAPAGIRQAIWAVSAIHRGAGLEDPTKAEPVRLALKRMARGAADAGHRQRQAVPLGEDDARLALRMAGPSPSRATLRDLALMLVMRDLLARRSEAVALDMKHLFLAKDGSATVLIARGKTDQVGEGRTLWLSPRTVTHLRRWLDSAHITEGPIFRAVNKAGVVGDRLTAGDVPRLLRRIAALAGLNAQGVSGHSCRVGMTQDLAASGAELPAIMQAGRWKSPTMPARYAERMVAGRGAVARFYEGRRD